MYNINEKWDKNLQDKKWIKNMFGLGRYLIIFV